VERGQVQLRTAEGAYIPLVGKAVSALRGYV